MSLTVSVEEASTHLDELLSQLAASAEDIIISREGAPMTTREMERTFKFVGVGSHFLLMGITAVVIGVLVSFAVVWGR